VRTIHSNEPSLEHGNVSPSSASHGSRARTAGRRSFYAGRGPDGKVRAACGLAVLTLLLVGGLAYRGLIASSESAASVRHTHQVLANIETLQVDAGIIESSLLGFVLTGRQSYLESYQTAIASTARSEAALAELTADHAGSQERLREADGLIANEIARAGTLIRHRQSGGVDAAAASLQSGLGEPLGTELRRVVGELRDEELRLLALADADDARNLSQTETILLVGSALWCLTALGAGWAVYRHGARRDLAELALGAGDETKEPGAKYRGLLEAAPDAMVVVDQGGEIVLVNLRAESEFGYRRDELVGQKVTDIIPEGFAERLIADGTRSPAEALAQQIGTGIELSARRKDGTLFPIEIMLSPLESAEGILVTAAIRDISVRKAAEKHLAQIEGRYRGLLEAAPDAMVVVDQGGQIVLVNVRAESQFGYRRDELLGQKVTNIIPEGFAERLIADSARSPAEALAQQIGTGIELSARRKDGTLFPIEIMLSPLESAEGVLVTAAIRDISVRKEAEKHLVEMEGRYRGLLEAAPDAIVVVDQGSEIVLANVQAESQFGYGHDELLGQKVTNIIPEGFAERLIADGTRTAADALAQQIGTGIELSARRQSGSEFPIEIMLSPLESADGTLVTAAIRDISVRKAAEKHLEQMEGRYRGLLEAAPDAMVVIDQAGEIVLVNAQAEIRFGYPRDELIGQKVTNIIPEGFAERLIADGTRTAAAALAQQIGTGIELSALRKDGTQFPIEIMLSPLESAEGTLVTAAIRDISVRKATERHLAQMEGRYRGLLEAAPDAMVVVNQAGEIVLLNFQVEKRFGYRREELLGQRVTSIIPEGFAERLIADALRSVEDARAQQIGTGIELLARRKSGSEFPIEIMLSPLESAEGVLVTAAIRDITTRKTAEALLLQKVAELNRSNEELAQFAYIASHDLQEPLRMVASYTQLLSRRYNGKLDADADEFIAFAVDGASRMQRLIQDLLSYSRVGTKGQDLLDTSSEEALEHALANLRGAIKESGALVTHDPLPTVLADETQLTQLFQNLVGNGIKYQSLGIPRIHVSAARNGQEKKWVFSVEDNGIGIDSQYFERIFGMFQRLHRRDEFAGTGIGLAICKKIVERHGGSISVESTPGHGSTFRFALAET
jgi:PAS domain S-box-containing protein